MDQHKAEHNKIFGSTTQNAGEEYNFLGDDYEVKIPFSHMKYERLFDIGQTASTRNANLTYIQCGYAAGAILNMRMQLLKNLLQLEITVQRILNRYCSMESIKL